MDYAFALFRTFHEAYALYGFTIYLVVWSRGGLPDHGHSENVFCHLKCPGLMSQVEMSRQQFWNARFTRQQVHCTIG